MVKKMRQDREVRVNKTISLIAPLVCMDDSGFSGKRSRNPS